MVKQLSAAVTSVILLAISSAALADDGIDGHGVKHVLLISVDGLHALDLTNYLAAHPDSAIGGGQPAATIGSAEAFDISDDGSLIWLTSPALAEGVVNNILSTPQNQQALGIQEIFAAASLRNKFNDPAKDPRTPDIILKVNTGVIFTGSKLAEHGGFNEDDVHTALIVSYPGLAGKTVKSAVTNQQVAASIVKALGAEPEELQAVKREQIPVLPFLFRDN
jgi:hypothetical protein